MLSAGQALCLAGVWTCTQESGKAIEAHTVAQADTVRTTQHGVLAGLAVLAVVLAPPVWRPGRPAAEPVAMAPMVVPLVAPPSALPQVARHADFGSHRPSAQARHVADWIATSHDNGDGDFILLDKRQATLYVFDAAARLRGASVVLLGAARGDDSVMGIGVRPIAEVQVHERTTPAGRFVAEPGRNALGEDVVWVDYDAAVSMHRVRATKAKERRLQRLASRTIADNRVSYGCINVPVDFYEGVVGPTVASRRTIVYVLPEERSAEQVFGSYDVAVVRTAARMLALASSH